jgi:hypothetical protein
MDTTILRKYLDDHIATPHINPTLLPSYQNVVNHINSLSMIHRRKVIYWCFARKKYSYITDYPKLCFTLLDLVYAFCFLTRKFKTKLLDVFAHCVSKNIIDKHTLETHRNTIATLIGDNEYNNLCNGDLPQQIHLQNIYNLRNNYVNQINNNINQINNNVYKINNNVNGNTNALKYELDYMCAKSKCLGKIKEYCLMNNIIPDSNTIESIYGNSCIQWNEVHLYIEELISSRMIITIQILEKILHPSIMLEHQIYCFTSFVDKINITDELLLDKYINFVFKLCDLDTCTILLTSLISKGTDKTFIICSLEKNGIYEFDKLIALKQTFDSDIDYEKYSDIICSLGNTDLFDKLINNSTFVLTNNSFNLACKSGNINMITKIINFKVIPTSDCFKFLPKKLCMDENFIDFLVYAGLKIDDYVYFILKNNHFFPKYGVTKSKIYDYYLNYKYITLESCSNKNNLHKYRLEFAKNFISKNYTNINNFKPDQYCYDMFFNKYLCSKYDIITGSIISNNKDILDESLELLESIYNLQPTKITLEKYVNIYIEEKQTEIMNWINTKYKNIKEGVYEDYYCEHNEKISADLLNVINESIDIYSVEQDKLLKTQINEKYKLDRKEKIIKKVTKKPKTKTIVLKKVVKKIEK